MKTNTPKFKYFTNRILYNMGKIDLRNNRINKQQFEIIENKYIQFIGLEGLRLLNK
jgi:hypothetical protein